MATSQQVASPGVYVSDDIGLEVTDGTSSRVQLGLLPSGTYGLRVVSSDGVTVIVDGTSDMFKIVAVGTITSAGTANTNTTAQVTLTALGALTVTPAHLCMIAPTTTPSNTTQMLPNGVLLNAGIGLSWVAAASGGAVTTSAGSIKAYAVAYALLDGSSNCVISLSVDNYQPATAAPRFAKYYILAEAAL